MFTRVAAPAFLRFKVHLELSCRQRLGLFGL